MFLECVTGPTHDVTVQSQGLYNHRSLHGIPAVQAVPHLYPTRKDYLKYACTWQSAGISDGLFTTIADTTHYCGIV